MTNYNKPTYWNNSGKYQAIYDSITLVPAAGKCDTVEGELIRAASKIYYDYYNNGFGNNWSGAWNYLDQYSIVRDISRELDFLHDYRCGVRFHVNDEIIDCLESLVNKILEYVIFRENQYETNDLDMFALSEDDAPDENESEYE